MTSPPTTGERPRLSALLERLEAIRRDLDRDDLDLEEQMQLYREGCEIAANARRILDETTAELEVLSGDEPERSET